MLPNPTHVSADEKAQAAGASGTNETWAQRRAAVLRSLRKQSIKPIPHAPGFWVGWRVHCACSMWVRTLSTASDLTQLAARGQA